MLALQQYGKQPPASRVKVGGLKFDFHHLNFWCCPSTFPPDTALYHANMKDGFFCQYLMPKVTDQAPGFHDFGVRPGCFNRWVEAVRYSIFDSVDNTRMLSKLKTMFLFCSNPKAGSAVWVWLSATTSKVCAQHCLLHVLQKKLFCLQLDIVSMKFAAPWQASSKPSDHGASTVSESHKLQRGKTFWLFVFIYISFSVKFDDYGLYSE